MPDDSTPSGYRSSHIAPAAGTVVLAPQATTPTPRRLWNMAADIATLPFVALGSRPQVEVSGTRVPLHLEFGRWAWRTERCVELALGLRALFAHDPADSLEIGNVLPLAGAGGHTVVDKYEQGDGVVNEDIVEFTPGRRYRLVISLSTLEHVGWDEVPRDLGKAAVALDRTSRLVDEGGALLVTIPAGYRRDLEAVFIAADSIFDTVTLLVRTARRPRWEARPLTDLPRVSYGTPFPCGNGILIGMRGRPFGTG